MGQGASTPYQTVGLCTSTGTPTSLPTPTPSPTTSCALVEALAPPSGAVCAYSGYLSRPNLLADWPIDLSDPKAFDTCTNACLTVETCSSFSYDAETRECQLYIVSLTEQKPRKSKTGSLYYDADCFVQSCDEQEIIASEQQAPEPETYYCGDETVYLTDPKGNYSENTYFPVALPFGMQLYGASAQSLYMSINGYLSFTSPLMTHPTPHNLPYFTHPSSNLALGLPGIEGGLPENSLAAFWAESAIANPPSAVLGAISTQSMQYTVTGVAGARTLTFSWRTSELHDVFSRISIDVIYQEAVPGVYTIKYDNVGDEGDVAVVGAQGTQASKLYAQYANAKTLIKDGTTLVFDSTHNTFKKVKTTKKVRSVKH